MLPLSTFPATLVASPEPVSSGNGSCRQTHVPTPAHVAWVVTDIWMLLDTHLHEKPLADPQREGQLI